MDTKIRGETKNNLMGMTIGKTWIIDILPILKVTITIGSPIITTEDHPSFVRDSSDD